MEGLGTRCVAQGLGTGWGLGMGWVAWGMGWVGWELDTGWVAKEREGYDVLLDVDRPCPVGYKE